MTTNEKIPPQSCAGVEEATPRRARKSLPAQVPLHGAWPAEMRAVTTAAFLDYSTTGELMKAVDRGEAPRPTAFRTNAGRREPVWALDICRSHVARRHDIENDASSRQESIGSLV